MEKQEESQKKSPNFDPELLALNQKLPGKNQRTDDNLQLQPKKKGQDGLTKKTDEEFFNSHDDFFSKVDDSKAAKSVPFFLTQKSSSRQKTESNTGQNEAKSVSNFTTSFQSISNSPEKKITSPDRKKVEPKNTNPITLPDFENDNNSSSNLNPENAKGAFHKFLPQQGKSPSSPRTPIKSRSNNTTPSYSYKTP